MCQQEPYWLSKQRAFYSFGCHIGTTKIVFVNRYLPYCWESETSGIDFGAQHVDEVQITTIKKNIPKHLYYSGN